MKPLVIILMGSRADLEHSQKIAQACQQFGLETVLHIGSAHKTPAQLLRLLEKYEGEDRLKVYITVAGRSNALSGFSDGAVRSPVIACPPVSEAFSGADLFSSVRMPSGIAPALVLEPVNAALLSAKMFAMHDPEVKQAVERFQHENVKKIMDDDRDLNQ